MNMIKFSIDQINIRSLNSNIDLLKKSIVENELDIVHYIKKYLTRILKTKLCN